MTTTISSIDSRILARVLKEGYGPGAWHGPDLESAVSDVTDQQAFARPAKGRHNIAEIALHHAWFVRSVTSQLTGAEAAPFIVDGEDWFELNGKTGPSWSSIRDTLAGLQQQLARAIDDIAADRITSPLGEAERFDLVLGITCHAVYHAGQIQLVKKLVEM